MKLYVERWQSRFQQLFFLANDDLRMLSEVCLDLILREEESGSETGFVIAGFGEDEYFPRLRSFEFESSIMGVHKIRDIENIDMRKDNARVVPFAQKEMVETFVQGRSTRLDSVLLHFIDDFFATEQENVRRSTDSDVQRMESEICSFLGHMNDRLTTEFREKLARFTADYHVDPIEMTIGAMPKEELAKMAQSLVNLTAIKRRSTPDAETVGGPTDVAVITKGDGMIWIERKHYFDPSLNPGFVSNYFQTTTRQGGTQ